MNTTRVQYKIKRKVPVTRKVRLHRRLTELRRRQDKLARSTKIYIVLGLLCLLASVLSLFIHLSDPFFKWFVPGLMFVYGVVCLGVPFALRPTYLAAEIREIEDELDMVYMEESSNVQKAEKLFKVHQHDLKRYYDQTLRHSSGIFWVGIVCLAIGFGVTILTLFLVSQNHDSDASQKIITASLGAATGILTNFVAVIYLKIYSGTINSLTEFHNRLVNTHHLHFANTLVAKIDNNALREQTLSKAALNLFNVPSVNSANEVDGNTGEAK